MDSNGTKTRFLFEVKRQLGLSNIEVETIRVENWRPVQPVDTVITRAFADLATTVERIDHVLSDQGVLFAMKTENASYELEALPRGMEQSACRDIAVPGRDWSFQLLTIRRTQEVAR
jgi:16S rRNA (guanine527-N7)-methyltransferase